MASCAFCGTTIVFGGVKDGDLRFCNQACYQKGGALRLSREIPKDIVADQLRLIHRGRCPKCKGSGPVDVHTSFRVYSALIFTRWNSIPNVSCRSCGIKSQLGDTVFSLVLGWWGFPWGLLMTPVQVGKNIYGMIKGPDEMKPSAKLENVVRVGIASQLIKNQNVNKEKS